MVSPLLQGRKWDKIKLSKGENDLNMKKVLPTMQSFRLQSYHSSGGVTFPQAGNFKQNCTKQLKMIVDNTFKVICYNMTFNLCSMICKCSRFLHNVYIYWYSVD